LRMISLPVLSGHPRGHPCHVHRDG